METRFRQRDRTNARELERRRRKASSVVWNCAFFTERGKKRPWLDGPPRTPLEIVGRKSSGREGCQKLDRIGTRPGRKPLFEISGDSAEARMRVVKRHSPRMQIREPRARVQSFEVGWVAKIGRTHLSLSKALGLSRKRRLGWSRQLAPKEIPRQLTRRGMDTKANGCDSLRAESKRLNTK